MERGRLDVVEEVLGRLHAKNCQHCFTRLAAVARRSRGSKGVDCGELDDGGSSLAVSAAAEGPLECGVSGRDRLADVDTLVEATENSYM